MFVRMCGTTGNTMFGTSTLMTSPVTLIVSLPRPPKTVVAVPGFVAWT